MSIFIHSNSCYSFDDRQLFRGGRTNEKLQWKKAWMSANRNIKNNAIINTKQLLKFNTKTASIEILLVFFYFDTILIFFLYFFFFNSLFFVVLSFACFTQSSFHLLNNIEMRLLTNSFALQQILFYTLCNSINNCPFFFSSIIMH